MYDQFYGLTGRPFQLTPDPAFYFESQTHRKALSYLGYGLAQGEGFVVITGEVGAGKSTLVAHLMATIDPARLTAAQVVTSKLDGEEIIHVVAQAFGLMIDGHDKASALGAIETFLHEEARAGRRCLLIVDESQNLSIEALEELRMLSNFQLGSHPLLQTLLLGQPEFRGTLSGHPGLEQLRQRVIASHHLDAMEPQEVQPYIEHRLGCVGWQGNPGFDEDVFAAIHAASGGIPRRINQVVNRLLLLGAVDEVSQIDAAMVQRVNEELSEDGQRGAPAQPAFESAADAVQTQASTEEVVAPSLSARQIDAEEEEVVVLPSFGVADADDAPVEDAVVPQTVFDAPEPVVQAAGVAAEDVEAMLAERDEQIVELQKAIVELADASEENEQLDQAAGEQIVAQGERIAALEARLEEAGSQEHEATDKVASLGERLSALETRVEDNDRQDGDANEQVAALVERIASLESRIEEQERTTRHTLTMLIEWIESGDGGRDAA